MPFRNQVQLITYPDSLGGSLSALASLLEKHFRDIFPGGVHILPPFPSSGDRGFAPQTYFEIEPRFGSWDDIRRISAGFPVVLDMMVNHISRQSPYFQDFLRQGRRSAYADLFLTLDKVWPGGTPCEEDVAKIFLRKPIPPFTDFTITATGKIERVWTTFWSEQIDVDVNAPVTRQLFTDILSHFSQYGVQMVRLDAVAYVNKKPGTSCFFVEPDLYHFMDWMQEQAHLVGIELLPEVHAQPVYQDKLAAHGYPVYNFALPLLVLHTLINRSSQALKEHLRTCPRLQFTNLDTHDGIPVQPDIDGLIEIDAAQAVVRACLERGANISPIFSVQHRLRPDFDAHQINCTYFSALGGRDEAYLAARAIQLFAPGVPQVYYVGLLADENDQAAVEQTGERRALNRHNFSEAEVEAALQKPVVQRFLELIRLRNTHPAFGGAFEVLPSPDTQLHLAWKNGTAACSLLVDLSTGQFSIDASL